MSARQASQTDRIRRHLECGLPITSLDAITLYGCTRLAARIHRLRMEGLDIRTTTIERNGSRYARYTLRA